MREAGAARIDPTMPSAMASSNCMDPTPVCDTSTGTCVARPAPDGGVSDAAATDGGEADASAPDAMDTDGSAADAMDTDATAMMDGGETDAATPGPDASADAAMADGSAAMDGGASMDGGSRDGGTGVLSGDGACACRVPAGPARGDSRGLAAVALLAGAAVAMRERSKRRR
jgi:hypothetical protein